MIVPVCELGLCGLKLLLVSKVGAGDQTFSSEDQMWGRKRRGRHEAWELSVVKYQNIKYIESVTYTKL